MKKIYIAPSIEQQEIVANQHLLAGSLPGPASSPDIVAVHHGGPVTGGRAD